MPTTSRSVTAAAAFRRGEVAPSTSPGGRCLSLYTGSSPRLVGLRDELRDARQMCAWKRRFVVQFLWSGPSPTEPGSASARLWPCHCCRSASSGRTSWSPWCLRPVRKGAPGRAVVALMGPQGGKGVLILSDSLNHASIVEGVKQCGATVKPFAHNDMPDLQRMLHTATTKGQAAFAKEKAGGAAQSSSSPAATAAVVPWRKIIVVVEGIYSMEGEFCNLPEVVALKKKYGACTWTRRTWTRRPVISGLPAAGLSMRVVCWLNPFINGPWPPGVAGAQRAVEKTEP